MPAIDTTFFFMRSRAPAVLPLVSMNSVTSSGTDSMVTASIDWATPLSVTRKSAAARFATGALPRFTDALMATRSVRARNTA